jgi:hypothetical protein
MPAFRWSAINGGGLCTLLGLVQMTESPTDGAANAVESYAVRPSNNSVPVPTFLCSTAAIRSGRARRSPREPLSVRR